MKRDRFWVQNALAAAALGVTGQALMCFGKAEGGIDPFLLGLFLWGSLPFVVSMAIAWWGSPYLGFFLALGGIAGNVATYVSVFASPHSSTAAIGMLFMPVVSLFLFLPVGLAVGLFIRWSAQNRPAP